MTDNRHIGSNPHPRILFLRLCIGYIGLLPSPTFPRPLNSQLSPSGHETLLPQKSSLPLGLPHSVTSLAFQGTSWTAAPRELSPRHLLTAPRGLTLPPDAAREMYVIAERRPRPRRLTRWAGPRVSGWNGLLALPGTRVRSRDRGAGRAHWLLRPLRAGVGEGAS